MVRADLAARRRRRRAVGGERDLDERRRRGEAARPRHGHLCRHGRARHGAGSVRAAAGRRLWAGAVPDLRRTRPPGGVAAAALLEDGAARSSTRPTAAIWPSWSRRRSPCWPRSPAAWASRSPSASCRSMPSAPAFRRDRRALAVGFRDRQRGPAMADRLDGRSPRPARRPGRLHAGKRRPGRPCCRTVSAQSPAIIGVIMLWGGISFAIYPVGLALLGQHFNGGDIARANTAFSMLYILGGLIGRPLDRCGDGCGRRSRPRLDARSVLFGRRGPPPCWRSTGAADNPDRP